MAPLGAVRHRFIYFLKFCNINNFTDNTWYRLLNFGSISSVSTLISWPVTQNVSYNNEVRKFSCNSVSLWKKWTHILNNLALEYNSAIKQMLRPAVSAEVTQYFICPYIVTHGHDFKTQRCHDYVSEYIYRISNVPYTSPRHMLSTKCLNSASPGWELTQVPGWTMCKDLRRLRIIEKYDFWTS